jgi:hypothetical protein
MSIRSILNDDEVLANDPDVDVTARILVKRDGRVRLDLEPVCHFEMSLSLTPAYYEYDDDDGDRIQDSCDGFNRLNKLEGTVVEYGSYQDINVDRLLAVLRHYETFRVCTLCKQGFAGETPYDFCRACNMRVTDAQRNELPEACTICLEPMHHVSAMKLPCCKQSMHANCVRECDKTDPHRCPLCRKHRFGSDDSDDE